MTLLPDLVTDYAPDGLSGGLAHATFSPDRTYRYLLSRTWDRDSEAGRLGWIMLNPSTADAMVNDPTIRRCISFAKAWGYGGITVVNLFAVRSPDPAVLATHADPIGPDNDAVLRGLIDVGALRDLVAAWGAHPFARQRATEVAALLRTARSPGWVRLWCLGRTKAGAPRHPLYVPNSQRAEDFA